MKSFYTTTLLLSVMVMASLPARASFESNGITFNPLTDSTAEEQQPTAATS